MLSAAVQWHRLTRPIYFSIAGFIIGEILTGVPLVWPAVSDIAWKVLFWGGASLMAASSCVMVAAIGLSGKYRC
jgi:hypothetical protein